MATIVSDSHTPVADGVTTFDIFTLPHTEDDVLTKLTVTALDHNDNIVKERTFENIPVTRNQITRYTDGFSVMAAAAKRVMAPSALLPTTMLSSCRNSMSSHPCRNKVLVWCHIR